MTIWLSVGGGGADEIVTTAERERPPEWLAVTWNVPGLAPAVYSPAAVIAPPVADHETVTPCVLPSLRIPVAVKFRVSAGVSHSASWHWVPWWES